MFVYWNESGDIRVIQIVDSSIAIFYDFALKQRNISNAIAHTV